MAQEVAVRICNGRAAPDVIRVIAESAAAEVLKAPVKKFEVRRTAPGGFIVQHITLPEAITELSDIMKINIEMQSKIIAALESNTKVCKKILRQNDEMSDES